MTTPTPPSVQSVPVSGGEEVDRAAEVRQAFERAVTVDPGCGCEVSVLNDAIKFATAREVVSRQEIDRLRAALQWIADFEPEWSLESLDNEDCPGCLRAHERNWPPSRLCGMHYSQLGDQQHRNERRQNNQHIDMKRIARAALSGVSETPEACDE